MKEKVKEKVKSKMGAMHCGGKRPMISQPLAAICLLPPALASPASPEHVLVHFVKFFKANSVKSPILLCVYRQNISWQNFSWQNIVVVANFLAIYSQRHISWQNIFQQNISRQRIFAMIFL